MGVAETSPPDAYARARERLSRQLHISTDLVEREAVGLLVLVTREIAAGNKVVIHRRQRSRWCLPLLRWLTESWELQELTILTHGSEAEGVRAGEEA